MEKPLANICIISQQVGKINRMNDNESRSCSNKLNAGNPGAVWKTATTSIMDHHITSHEEPDAGLSRKSSCRKRSEWDQTSAKVNASLTDSSAQAQRQAIINIEQMRLIRIFN